MITALDKNTALVLIDLQKGVVQMAVAHSIKDVLERSASLVNAFRKEGLPVVIVNVVPATPVRQLRKEQNVTNFALPKDFAEIVDEIETNSSDIFITKGTWNAFYNTNLHTELQKHNVTGIVLAGVSTSIGVEGTARSANELGYNLSFATDAMTDRIAEAHNHSVNIIFPRIGEVGNCNDIIEKLKERK